MRWQRVAQAVIAVFVTGFIALLVVTLRRETADPAPPERVPPREAGKDVVVENPGGCEQIQSVAGRRVFTLKCGKHFSYKDGRQRLTEGVELSLPRADREFVVRASEAEVLPQDAGVKQAVFKGDVRVTSEGGLTVSGAEASYTDADGLLKIPGRVEFTKGRMKGSGVNATYDRNREVLWILEQAKVSVAADARTGESGVDATADAIGLARTEHYLRMQRNAQLTAQGRVTSADEIVIRLSDDDQRVRAMELRGASRITGGTGGPQAMSARDIDLAYAEDGRTLQSARLVENAVVQMAGADAGKRISANTITMGLGPDGTTVTTLDAIDRVQVDLPPEAQGPAKRIRSTRLVAAGAGGGGLQNATFSGAVEYREIRTVRQKAPAGERMARSESLVVETLPGFGAIERADFRGNVRFTDGPDLAAEAPQGLYFVGKDRLELLPGEGLPGPPPHVADGRVSISARTIQFTISTRDMTAETKVRSTMAPQKGKGPAGGGAKVPSMLQQDVPVNVTANRLNYSGSASRAEYTGNVTLWQEPDTTIRAETIVLDDKSGNLTATGNAVTAFTIEEVDPKTGARKRTPSSGTADTFTYDDAKRLATYTGKAHIRAPQGDVTGDRIELFMRSQAKELERAEAHGASGRVVIKEGARMAMGSHLTYTAADDQYLIVGTPVELVEEKKGSCTRMLGTTATFKRTTESARVAGNGAFPTETKTLPSCPPGLLPAAPKR